MKKYILTVFLLLPAIVVWSQAGKGTYKLLELPVSARMAAMGGSNVALHDNDLNLSAVNPASLNHQTHNMLALNYSNYLSDLNFGSVSFGRNFGDKNYTSYGINYLDYGKFLSTSEIDQEQGTFTAKDIMLSVSYARLLHPRWTIGLSFKPLMSFYERYQSFGFGFDTGLSYNDEKHLFYGGLTIRNLGMRINGYKSTDGIANLEMLPWNIEVGLSKGFKHAPIRISITAHNLQKWNLNYPDDSKKDQNEDKNKAADFFDMLFRHTIFNLEILPTKNTYILVSYNHRRGRELSVSDYKTAAGFSFGAGIKIYKFHLDIGFLQYQAGQFSYHVSLTTFLSEFGIK